MYYMLTDVSWSFMFVELYAAIVGLNVVYITTGVERILLQIPCVVRTVGWFRNLQRHGGSEKSLWA